MPSYYDDKSQRRTNHLPAILVGAAIAALIAAVVSSTSRTVQVEPPPLQVKFFTDGQASVYNPGYAPEVHVSLCVYSQHHVVLERFETPVRAGFTGLLGPTACPDCEQAVVLGPDCQGIIVAEHR